MAQFASSNFNGTNGDTIQTVDANWISHPSSARSLQIVNNRARQEGTGTSAYYYDAAPAGADYDVSVTLYHPGTLTGSTMGTTGRMSTSATTFYHARVSTTGTIQLFKFVAGTATSLGSTTRTVASGGSYLIELRMSGTTIELWWDGEGSAAISATDSAISAAGYPGIRSTASTTPTDTLSWQIEDFSADEAGGGGASQTVAFTLEDIAAAVSQTLIHDQSLTATLDGVTFAASQTLSHSQALAATLDGIAVEINQSAAPSSKEQSLAVVLDGIQVAIAQEGPANLIDTHDGFWAKEWKRIRAREKRKYQAEVQERVEEIQDEIAEVEQQIVEVKQVAKPKKAIPARDFYAEQARIVEHLIARRNQLIEEEDEELLLLL